MIDNLRKFIDVLDAAGELTRITKKVDPVLEISRLTDRESKKPRGGKALLFTHVRGSKFPVAINLFGSPRRIRMALNVDELDDLGRRVQRYIDLHPPRSFKDIMGLAPLVTDVVKFFPRSFRGKCPPCQEVIYTHDEVNLGRLPVIKCWPKDAGRFITLPLVFTRGLSTGKRNLGMYRMQIFDKNTTGMHWHIHKDGAHYYDEYTRAGKRMPVAVAIGADPVTVYTATAPMPRGMDEMVLAGFIRRKPVRLAKCLTVDLSVPAEAEFILEGYVQPGELRREGPFGDHTGYYSLADNYPVFHVTALTHRKNPIYQTTLVGRPPMEDCYLAKATERLFLPMLRTVMPEIKDYYFPWEGVFHNIVVVSIDKAYAGHAQKVISGLWGQGQMSFCKVIVVVDADIDPQDHDQVLRTLIHRLDIRSDLARATGVLDVLDHSSPSPNFGHKIGIDLTARVTDEPPRSESESLPRQPFSRSSAESLKANVDGIVALRELMAEQSTDPNRRIRLIAIAITKSDPRGGQAIAEEILNNEVLDPFDIVILFDATIDLYDESRLLWKLFNNVDPGRDLFIRKSQMVIDACNKGPMDGHYRKWPDELTFD